MMGTQMEREAISLSEQRSVLWDVDIRGDSYFLSDTTWIISISSEYDRNCHVIEKWRHGEVSMV
jgi:hypothetical protein